MASRKTDIAFPGCVRIGDPDFDSLSTQTRAAQGRRSLNAFAGDCNVNASTLSRIINKKITSPCTEAVIKSIAANAEEGSGVTYETLLTALGMAKVNIEYKIQSPDGACMVAEDTAPYLSNATKARIVRYQEEFLAQTMREIVQNELLMSGYTVSIEMDAFIFTTKLVRFRSDFLATTDALQEDGVSKWAFEVNGQFRSLEDNLKRLFSLAYVDSPEKKSIKLSLVTSKRSEFYDVVGKLDDVKVHDDVSLILVDLDSRKVVDEYIIPRHDGKERTMVFKKSEQKDAADAHSIEDGVSQ